MQSTQIVGPNSHLDGPGGSHNVMPSHQHNPLNASLIELLNCQEALQEDTTMVMSQLMDFTTTT